MDKTIYSDELQHWGIKGMRWGVRRYQNSDGTLTAAGQKRYNKEVDKLKKETAKVAAAEKVAATRKKTQAKLDDLESKKQQLEARKQALKNGGKKEENPNETPEQRKERLLNSVDAKELYEHKNELSTFELNERINRIDTEARLKSRIVEEQKKTGMDYMDGAKNKLDKATNMFRSIDNAYSTVANSAIGKTLAKKLGIEVPKKEFNADEFFKNINNYSDEEVNKGVNRIIKEKMGRAAYKEIKRSMDEDVSTAKAAKEAAKAAKEAAKEAKEAEKKAKADAKKQAEAQKKVDEYNERWQKGESDDKINSVNDSSANASGRRDTTNPYLIEDTHTERAKTDGNVYGTGTSRFTGWQSDKYATEYDVDASEGNGYKTIYSSYTSKPVTSVSTEVYRSGYEKMSESLEGPLGSTSASSLNDEKK